MKNKVRTRFILALAAATGLHFAICPKCADDVPETNPQLKQEQILMPKSKPKKAVPLPEQTILQSNYANPTNLEIVVANLDEFSGEETYLAHKNQLYSVRTSKDNLGRDIVTLTKKQYPIRTQYLGRSSDLNRDGWFTKSELSQLQNSSKNYKHEPLFQPKKEFLKYLR